MACPPTPKPTTPRPRLRPRPSCFVEIDDPWSPPAGEEAPPELIECYVLADVNPKLCGPLAREMNAALPLRIPGTASRTPVDGTDGPDGDAGFPRTDHLKRIRRRPATADELSARSAPEIVREVPEQSTNNDERSCEATGGKDKHLTKRSKPNKNGKRQQIDKQQQKSSPWSLDMLVGSVAAVDAHLSSVSPKLASILQKYDQSTRSPIFTRCPLPGRPARHKQELEEWNRSAWPTLFFEEKTEQHKKGKMALTAEEITMMKRGMWEAINDAHEGRRQWEEWNGAETAFPIAGAVVVNLENGDAVSRASEERRMQATREGGGADVGTKSDTAWSSFPDEASPLCTPTLLAIQGVSRRERWAALGCGMGSEEFRRGQYLCTGHAVYLTKEPDAYEAMALVHSRVRHVVFGVPDTEMGGLGGAAGRNASGGGNTGVAGIHYLPGTNHHYRAFRLDWREADDGVVGDDEVGALVESLQKLHRDSIA